ncbi:MAG: hypothetical protein CL902_07680 [Dehalococcoidia bacterium]|nr:hypothetical protein [Dehalococcoidia bacterium]
MAGEAQPPLTVLLVEDDKPLLGFFSTILRREGYAVLIVENGLEALELAEREPEAPIDILLTDVSMPYMGEIQLAKSMMKTRPKLLVLLTSGLPFQEVTDRCGPEFRSDFLAKPFSVSELAGKINTLAKVA